MPAHTSQTFWDHLARLDRLPPRVLVLGGGVMGCELAQALARLGAEVSLVEQGSRLLASEEPALAQLALQALQRSGVRIWLDSRVLQAGAWAAQARSEPAADPADRAGTQAGPERLESPGYRAQVHTPAGVQQLPFDLMVLALGRRPRWQGLGLQELGLQSFELDEYLQTPIPGLFAAGDVTGGRQLTSLAAHQGWHAAVHALQGLWRMRPDRVQVPQVIFIDPEIARVGLNAEQARAQQIDFETTRLDFADLDRAIIAESREGYIELLTRSGSGRLIGATVVGAQAGELLAPLTLAINRGLRLRHLLSNVLAYPTLAEIIRLAAGAHRRRHQGRWLLAALDQWHSWRRG